jgi:GNAT superfamily N-acetyltransferase
VGSIAIRRARPDEASTLTALAHRAKAHWGYPPEWMASWRDDLTISPDYIRAHEVWAADEDARLAGVCALERGATSWKLEHVWVDPESMGRGIGQALVTHALQHAATVAPMNVHVVADPHAATFYEKLGWLRTGTIPAPMPGAPERVMGSYQVRPPTAASASFVLG